MNAHRLRWLFLLSALASLSACSLLVPQVEAPEACTFPPGTVLAYAGRASPFQLGFGAENENVPGDSYVTAEPVQIGRAEGPPQRWYCYIAGNSTSWWEVPDDWTPPLGLPPSDERAPR